MSKLLMAAFAGVCTVFMINFGGLIEGRIYPVIGPLTLSRLVSTDADRQSTVWEGQATKYRGCDFVAVEWFLGPRSGRHLQVTMQFLDPPQIRMAGRIHWSGIAVNLAADSVARNSFADILHHCPWRPWLTRTRFYDPQR